CFTTFFRMIRVLRDTGELDHLSSRFSAPLGVEFRESQSRYRTDRETKSLPDIVVKTLDENISLIEPVTGSNIYTKEEYTSALTLIYILLRDTGRRPIELCSLTLDCLGGS